MFYFLNFSVEVLKTYKFENNIVKLFSFQKTFQQRLEKKFIHKFYY